MFRHTYLQDFPDGSVGKEFACNAGDTGDDSLILGQENHLEKGMATHSTIPAWRIPWTKEPGRLQSIGLQSQTGLIGYTTTASSICSYKK